MTRKQWIERPIFMGLLFALYAVIDTHSFSVWRAGAVGAICGVMRLSYHWSQS